MTLAKRIRDCRYAKGWGPDELASRAEISRTALYQIESGKTELPRAATLRRIARALDVSVDLLLSDADIGVEPISADRAAIGVNARPAATRRDEKDYDAYSARERDRDEMLVAVADRVGGRRGAANGSNSAMKRGDLAKKFHELLDSPLAEDVVRFIEETHRSLAALQVNG